MRLALALSGLLAATFGLSGCAGGNGEGEVYGSVDVPSCGFSRPDYNLRPDYFSQENWENTAFIRVQRGSDYEDVSDGLTIVVNDVDFVAANLGAPIDLSDPDRSIEAVFRLGESCWDGRREPSVVMAIQSGTITFDAIHESSATPETTATFSNLVFSDELDEAGTATLSGYFTFIFTRGRPAQRFP